MASPESIAAFRAAFPEFGDATAWPDDRVSIALDIASDRVSKLGRCAGSAEKSTYLTQLYAAHILMAIGPLNGDGGGSTDGGAQLTSSKTVGDVSIVYAQYLAVDANAGSLNSDKYGRLYWELTKNCGPLVLQL